VVVVLPDPFRGNGGMEELHGNPEVRPRLKVWTRDKKWKAKDGAPERLRCGTIQKEVSFSRLGEFFQFYDEENIILAVFILFVYVRCSFSFD